MPKPITVDPNSEFFMAIAKEGIHSFIMLGVMVDGKPNLLARVGKENLIDPNFGVSAGSQLTMFKKNIFSHTEASLVDEGISEREDAVADISYQAYSLTFQQYLEFLALAREIHSNQLEHYKDRIAAHPSEEAYRNLSYPEKGVRKLTSGIRCYVPGKPDEEGKVTFKYQRIDADGASSPRSGEAKRNEIISGASELHVSNTCRTTARSLLSYILDFTPEVPSLFAIGLDYKTKLVGGVPTANSFYILPPPPASFKMNPKNEADVMKMKTLQELYKRLENIPKTEPTSPTTREKFDAVKKLYQDLLGKPDLPLQDLLDNITTHRIQHNKLFDVRRGQSIVSQFLEAIGIGVKTGTQRAFDRMEADVKKEIDRLNNVEAKVGKGADEEGFQSDERRPPTVAM